MRRHNRNCKNATGKNTRRHVFNMQQLAHCLACRIPKRQSGNYKSACNVLDSYLDVTGGNGYNWKKLCNQAKKVDAHKVSRN